MSTERRFVAQIAKAGSRSFIPIPFDPDVIWGAKGRHCVHGTIGGRVWRGTVTDYGGQKGLPVGPTWLRDNDLTVGDEVEVAVKPEGPQSDALAEDLTSAFAANPGTKAFFDSLTSFHRRNYMRWIDEAKRSETRAKRIAQMMEMLARGERM